MTACVAVISPDIKLGREVQIYEFVKRCGCEIGDETSWPKRSLRVPH